MLWKYDPAIVAVTGNVGKTSTKDAIATVLSPLALTRKSEKSQNSEIGLPLTILGLQNAWDDPWGWLANVWEGFLVLVLPHEYPEWLVLEVGADHPGDIEKVSKWLKSDIVVVTQIGEIPVHVAYFSSPDELAKEKAFLLKTIRPGGTAILNADDKRVMAMETPRWARIVTVGFTDDADVSAMERKIFYEHDTPAGIACKIEHEGSTVPFFLKGVLGYQNFYGILVACAAGIVRGQNVVASIEALKYYIPPKGRMKILEGKNTSILIDDTYNASPKATEAALRALEEVKTNGRKIAVLGDMKELGGMTRDAHELIGTLAGKVCDEFVAVGEAMQHAANKAEDAGCESVLRFKDSTKAAEALKDSLKLGDVVLVKGSQSMRMERIVEVLLAHPDEKQKLLVRQEEEWLKR